jgi:site-specific recombinase XerD
MTEDEAKAVLEQPNTRTATGARDRAMLLCLYRLGLRVGEVVGLTKRHLQADAGKHGKLVFAGKGSKEREVWLDADTRTAVDLWLTHRPKIAGNGDALFCRIKRGAKGGPVGDRLTTRAVQGMVKHYATEALGAERGAQIHPHVFRHSHATGLLRLGKPLPEIQGRLGHARLETTAIYMHVDSEAQRELAESLPSLTAAEAKAEDGKTADLAEALAALPPEQKKALAEALLR